MGGASTQITFEVQQSVRTFIRTSSISQILIIYPIHFPFHFQEKLAAHLTTEVNLGCDSHMTIHKYKLYVSTFLGYGATTARIRYLEKLLRMKNSSVHRYCTTSYIA